MQTTTARLPASVAAVHDAPRSVRQRRAVQACSGRLAQRDTADGRGGHCCVFVLSCPERLVRCVAGLDMVTRLWCWCGVESCVVCVCLCESQEFGSACDTQRQHAGRRTLRGCCQDVANCVLEAAARVRHNLPGVVHSVLVWWWRVCLLACLCVLCGCLRQLQHLLRRPSCTCGCVFAHSIRCVRGVVRASGGGRPALSACVC